MRIILFLCLLVAIPATAQHGLKRGFIAGHYTTPPPPAEPRIYYISEDGTGDGLTSGNPAPISVLLSAQIITGDEIRFNKGDVFDLGNFTIQSVNNITIGSFGTGANPQMIGSHRIVLAFTSDGAGNWYIPLADAPKWVMEGDELLRRAESGWIPITSSISGTVKRVNAATINALPESIVGAAAIGKELAFRMTNPVTVTAYNSGTGDITFSGTVASATGMPILIGNQKQFLTTADDWYYSDLEERLYIKSATDPTGRDIRIISEDYGLKIVSCDGVSIDGVDFKHYYFANVFINHSANVTMTNFRVHAGRNYGILTNGNGTTNLILQDGEVDNEGLIGIGIGTTQGGLIERVHVHDIGLQDNIGYPIDINRTGGAAISPTYIVSWGSTQVPNNIDIFDCELNNLGYHGFQCFGNNWDADRLHIHHFNMRFTDGAGAYFYYANSLNSSTANNIIHNSYIHDGIGNTDGITSGTWITNPGIYFDAGVSNTTAENNTIERTGTYGIYCNFWNTGHKIRNNIIRSITHGIVIQQNSTPNASYPYTNVTDCEVTGNIIASTTSSSRGLTLINWNNNASWTPFTSASLLNNNHYVNPYSTNVNARSNNGSAFTAYTLSGWQTLTGMDASSTGFTNWKVTPDSDDILIQYNATDSPADFTVPAGYKDYNNGSFTNPVSIPARTGLIYFQNP